MPRSPSSLAFPAGEKMLFTDLNVGDNFRFISGSFPYEFVGSMWEYRGNNWYGWLYSGGPYHGSMTPDVVRYPKGDA